MLYGYFAVSGEQKESVACCLCGFIAEADDWDSFDEAWKARVAALSSRFDAAACLWGSGDFQQWEVNRRCTLLADLSGALVHSSLVPMGAFVARKDFSELSSRDRTVLAAEGIQTALDLVFCYLIERIIHHVYEESEKISIFLDRQPQSAAARYQKLFNRHVNRYLLAPHLMGALAFDNAGDCSGLQAATLLAEAVLFLEKQKLSAAGASSSFPVPAALQQAAETVHERGRLSAPELRNLEKQLKSCP